MLELLFQLRLSFLRIDDPVEGVSGVFDGESNEDLAVCSEVHGFPLAVSATLGPDRRPTLPSLGIGGWLATFCTVAIFGNDDEINGEVAAPRPDLDSGTGTLGEFEADARTDSDGDPVKRPELGLLVEAKG